MNFNHGTVGRNRLCFDADHLFMLRTPENSVKNTVSAPTIHTGTDAVPIAETFRQTSPPAPMFKDIQHSVQRIEIVDFDIASRSRETIGYFFVLFSSYFHGTDNNPKLFFWLLMLTGPSALSRLDFRVNGF